MSEDLQKTTEEKMDFETRQNAVGFFNIMLKVVLRNPELKKKVFSNQENENNGNTNNTDKS